MTFISIILLLLITMLLLRSITTIIHELGHGIAALLLTDKKVVLYIAQSGHWRGKVLRFKMGRLSGTVHFNPIPLSYGGWWVGEPRITVKQLRIITWAGPLTAVLVGSITLFLALLLSTTSVIQLLAMLFFVNCLLDFFMSMYGRGFPGTYLNGTPIFDDGKFLKILDQIGDLDKKYAEAVQLFLEDKLEEAKVQFELLALCLYSSYNALGHLILIAHRSSDTEQTGILSEELKQYYKEDINPGYTLAYFCWKKENRPKHFPFWKKRRRSLRLFMDSTNIWKQPDKL